MSSNHMGESLFGILSRILSYEALHIKWLVIEAMSSSNSFCQYVYKREEEGVA